MSYVLCLMSYVLCLMSYGLCLMSMSYVLCLMSYVLCLMSYVLCLRSYVLGLMSYVLCLTSYVLCLMYYVLCLMSYDLCLMSYFLLGFSCLQIIVIHPFVLHLIRVDSGDKKNDDDSKFLLLDVVLTLLYILSWQCQHSTALLSLNWLGMVHKITHLQIGYNTVIPIKNS
jgi:hypothetical protein